MTQSAASILAQPLPELTNVVYVPVIGSFKHIAVQGELDEKVKAITPLLQHADGNIQTQAKTRLREVTDLNLKLLAAAHDRIVGTIALIVVCIFTSVLSIFVGGLFICLNIVYQQNYEKKAEQLRNKLTELDRRPPENESQRVRVRISVSGNQSPQPQNPASCAIQ